MEMARTDMAIRLEVGGLTMGSSASTKSRSLELLLVLHTLLGVRGSGEGWASRWQAVRFLSSRNLLLRVFAV